MGRPSRRRTVVLVVAALGLVWLGAVAWTLLAARASAQEGADALREVRQGATVRSLTEDETREDLARAERRFAAADDRLASPVLAPLRVLPLAGRQVEAADGLVAAGEDGAAAALAAVDDLVELTDRPIEAGPARLEVLRDLAATASRARRAIAAIEVGGPSGLVGPLGDAVEELDEQAAGAEEAAATLESVSLAVAAVLDGPEPYLLLGANNAEMRNGSGMYLSAAEVGFDEGRLLLGDVRPTAELVLPAGTVPVTGDLAENWPWLDSGRDLRTLGLTADLPQNAAVAVDQWAAIPGGGEVAGVLVVDVDAVRALLRAVGPVEVDGVRYTADTVRGQLLRDQYRDFEGAQDERRDQLGEVARALFERIEAGDWELEELATQLVDAVAGRHLLVWSVDPEVQQAWSDVGADGHLTETTLSAALLSRSAAKLDSWIETEAAVTTTPAPGTDRRRVELAYEITNGAPADGPAYLVGPNVEGLEAGDHVGLVVVNLPAGTTEVAMEGARTILAGGDGPTVVHAGEVTVRRGETVVVTVTALLPAGLDAVTVEPSARIPRTVWTVDGREVEGDRRRTVDLGR